MRQKTRQSRISRLRCMRADQDRSSGSVRAGGEVQPTPAHRGRVGRCRSVRGASGLLALGWLSNRTRVADPPAYVCYRWGYRENRGLRDTIGGVVPFPRPNPVDDVGSGWQPVARSAPGGSLTGRALILFTVLGLPVVALSVPVRNWLTQRAEVASLRSDIASSTEQIELLNSELDRWSDPRSSHRRRVDGCISFFPGKPPHHHLPGWSAGGVAVVGRCGADFRVALRLVGVRPASRRSSRCFPRSLRTARRVLLHDGDLSAVERQIGRTPRCSRRFVSMPCGDPALVTTAPRLDDGTPFPTTYYVTCALDQRHRHLEGDGCMREMEDRLAVDDALRGQYLGAHERYLAERRQLGGSGDRRISAGGMPRRVKCLHVWWASRLRMAG